MAPSLLSAKLLPVASSVPAAAAVSVASAGCWHAEMMRIMNNNDHAPVVCAVSRARTCWELAFVSPPAQGLGFGLQQRRRIGTECGASSSSLSRRRRSYYGCSSDRRERGSVVAMLAVPVRPVTLSTEREGVGKEEEEMEFDVAMPPPFTLADIRAVIPKHCWIKNPWKSMSFVARDVAIVFGLAAAAAYVNSWFVWPFYWLAQGTMFWALFVLGHDCGHGSFSNNKNLNSLVGHLTHSSILVPYHGWRISHRTHHQNHGHVENDESWHPISETTYRGMNFWGKTGRLSFPWAMLAYPFYLWSRSPGKRGSHFDPKSDLFLPNEAKDVITSTACWTAMLAIVVALTFVVGPMWILKLYVVPYWFNVIWLDVVTYLHHHGYDKKVPWFRGMEWNYMRGGLSTIDRDYGWFNNIHHDIGTHVVHHLFPQIPHYNLIEATEAIKPVLGEYYREPKKSGPIPIHLVEPLVISLKQDHYVSDNGDVVFYQTDPTFSLSTPQHVSERTA